MKKKIFSVLASALLLTVLFTGCGGSKTAGNSTAGSGAAADAGELTKAQWIGMLGDRFGYTDAAAEKAYYSDVRSDHSCYRQIQSCAEWEITEQTKTFEPDKAADWQYVLETSVRAIGLDHINGSAAGVTVSQDSLVEFFTSNIANVLVSDMSTTPDAEEASQVLDCAYQYYMTLTPQDRYEVTYNDGVREVEASAITLKGDGVTAMINDGAGYAAGEVVYMKPADDAAPCAVKVVSCNDGLMTYELAEMEDVFEELVICGSYDAVIVGAEAADYVTLSRPKESDIRCYPVSMRQAVTGEDSLVRGIYRDDPYQVQNAGVDVSTSKNGVVFHADKDGVDFTASLKNFRVDPDIDFGIVRGLQKAEATVSFDDEIRLDYQSERFSKTIPLGRVMLQLGSTPLQVEVSLTANIGIDGEVTVNYSSTVVGKVKYCKGRGLAASVCNNNAKFDFHAQVTMTAEPTVKVDLQCLKRSIANVKVTTGVVGIATANVDLLGGQPACIDLYLYVPLRWAINEDGCMITSISSKLKRKDIVWNSENSAITQRFHWEDLKPVQECTRGKEQEVVTPVVGEDGKPYEEYKIFDFEEIVFGHIDVASSRVYLNKGETMTLGILSVPDGYTQNDLVYSVQESDICSASGGRITAAGEGSTVLKISTSDGKYSVFVTVTVAAEYNDTSGFQPL